MKTAFLALLTACAAEDAPFDPASCDAPRTYRIDQVELPRDHSEAGAIGFDLDGDQVSDNLLGKVSAALTNSLSPLDLQGHANAHLAVDTDWRISIADCGSQRLVAIGEPDGELTLSGTLVEGRVEASGAGFASVPLIALFDGTGEARSVFATAERTDLRVVETGDELTGTAGFGIAATLATPLVIYAMTSFFDQHLLDDVRAAFDTNSDGVITESEVAHSSFARTLLFPDVVIDDVRALSLAVAIHATRVRRM